jgi:hypothetical protein
LPGAGKEPGTAGAHSTNLSIGLFELTDRPSSTELFL